VWANHRWAGMSTSALRGGPAIHVPGSNNAGFNVGSDRRRTVRLGLNGSHWREHETGIHREFVAATISVRPSPRFDASLAPSVNRFRHAWQYVAAPVTVDGSSREYIFAGLDQTTVSLTTRLSYTFTPDLTFQLYAQPFLSAAGFTAFRRVPTRAAARSTVGSTRSTAANSAAMMTGTYTAQVGGTAVRFRDPDFTRASLRSNAVLRWEYRPGSTLFVVWSHGRGDTFSDGSFDFRRGVGRPVAAARHERAAREAELLAQPVAWPAATAPEAPGRSSPAAGPGRQSSTP
jgi:hypothetical protein